MNVEGNPPFTVHYVFDDAAFDRDFKNVVNAVKTSIQYLSAEEHAQLTSYVLTTAVNVWLNSHLMTLNCQILMPFYSPHQSSWMKCG